MTVTTLLLIELTVVGVAMTLYGLVAAVLGARRDVKYAEGRLLVAQSLDDWYHECRQGAHQEAALARLVAIKKAVGDIPVDWGNVSYQGSMHAIGVLKTIFKGAVANLVIAGIGGVILGVAGVEAFLI